MPKRTPFILTSSDLQVTELTEIYDGAKKIAEVDYINGELRLTICTKSPVAINCQLKARSIKVDARGPLIINRSLIADDKISISTSDKVIINRNISSRKLALSGNNSGAGNIIFKVNRNTIAVNDLVLEDKVKFTAQGQDYDAAIRVSNSATVQKHSSMVLDDASCSVNRLHNKGTIEAIQSNLACHHFDQAGSANFENSTISITEDYIQSDTAESSRCFGSNFKANVMKQQQGEISFSESSVGLNMLDVAAGTLSASKSSRISVTEAINIQSEAHLKLSQKAHCTAGHDISVQGTITTSKAKLQASSIRSTESAQVNLEKTKLTANHDISLDGRVSMNGVVAESDTYELHGQLETVSNAVVKAKIARMTRVTGIARKLHVLAERLELASLPPRKKQNVSQDEKDKSDQAPQQKEEYEWPPFTIENSIFIVDGIQQRNRTKLDVCLIHDKTNSGKFHHHIDGEMEMMGCVLQSQYNLERGLFGVMRATGSFIRCNNLRSSGPIESKRTALACENLSLDKSKLYITAAPDIQRLVSRYKFLIGRARKIFPTQKFTDLIDPEQESLTVAGSALVSNESVLLMQGRARASLDTLLVQGDVSLYSSQLYSDTADVAYAASLTAQSGSVAKLGRLDNRGETGIIQGSHLVTHTTHHSGKLTISDKSQYTVNKQHKATPRSQTSLQKHSRTKVERWDEHGKLDVEASILAANDFVTQFGSDIKLEGAEVDLQTLVHSGLIRIVDAVNLKVKDTFKAERFSRIQGDALYCDINRSEIAEMATIDIINDIIYKGNFITNLGYIRGGQAEKTRVFFGIDNDFINYSIIEGTSITIHAPVVYSTMMINGHESLLIRCLMYVNTGLRGQGDADIKGAVTFELLPHIPTQLPDPKRLANVKAIAEITSEVAKYFAPAFKHSITVTKMSFSGLKWLYEGDAWGKLKRAWAVNYKHMTKKDSAWIEYGESMLEELRKLFPEEIRTHQMIDYFWTAKGCVDSIRKFKDECSEAAKEHAWSDNADERKGLGALFNKDTMTDAKDWVREHIPTMEQLGELSSFSSDRAGGQDGSGADVLSNISDDAANGIHDYFPKMPSAADVSEWFEGRFPTAEQLGELLPFADGEKWASSCSDILDDPLESLYSCAQAARDNLPSLEELGITAAFDYGKKFAVDNPDLFLKSVLQPMFRQCSFESALHVNGPFAGGINDSRSTYFSLNLGPQLAAYNTDHAQHHYGLGGNYALVNDISAEEVHHSDMVGLLDFRLQADRAYGYGECTVGGARIQVNIKEDWVGSVTVSGGNGIENNRSNIYVAEPDEQLIFDVNNAAVSGQTYCPISSMRARDSIFQFTTFHAKSGFSATTYGETLISGDNVTLEEGTSLEVNGTAMVSAKEHLHHEGHIQDATTETPKAVVMLEGETLALKGTAKVGTIVVKGKGVDSHDFLAGRNGWGEKYQAFQMVKAAFPEGTNITFDKVFYDKVSGRGCMIGIEADEITVDYGDSKKKFIINHGLDLTSRKGNIIIKNDIGIVGMLYFDSAGDFVYNGDINVWGVIGTAVGKHLNLGGALNTNYDVLISASEHGIVDKHSGEANKYVRDNQQQLLQVDAFRDQKARTDITMGKHEAIIYSRHGDVMLHVPKDVEGHIGIYGGKILAGGQVGIIARKSNLVIIHGERKYFDDKGMARTAFDGGVIQAGYYSDGTLQEENDLAFEVYDIDMQGGAKLLAYGDIDGMIHSDSPEAINAMAFAAEYISYSKTKGGKSLWRKFVEGQKRQTILTDQDLGIPTVQSVSGGEVNIDAANGGAKLVGLQALGNVQIKGKKDIVTEDFVTESRKIKRKWKQHFGVGAQSRRHSFTSNPHRNEPASWIKEKSTTVQKTGVGVTIVTPKGGKSSVISTDGNVDATALVAASMDPTDSSAKDYDFEISAGKKIELRKPKYNNKFKRKGVTIDYDYTGKALMDAWHYRSWEKLLDLDPTLRTLYNLIQSIKKVKGGNNWAIAEIIAELARLGIDGFNTLEAISKGINDGSIVKELLKSKGIKFDKIPINPHATVLLNYTEATGKFQTLGQGAIDCGYVTLAAGEVIEITEGYIISTTRGITIKTPNLILLGAALKHSLKEKTYTAAVGVMLEGAPIVGGGFKRNKEKGKTHVNVNITTEGHLDIQVGSTKMRNANVSANSASGSFGDTTITSDADTKKTKHEGLYVDTNGKFTPNIGRSRSARVTTPSGIHVKDGFENVLFGDVRLRGSEITTDGQNDFVARSITAKDVKEFNKGFSLALSVNMKELMRKASGSQQVNVQQPTARPVTPESGEPMASSESEQPGVATIQCVATRKVSPESPYVPPIPTITVNLGIRYQKSTLHSVISGEKGTSIQANKVSGTIAQGDGREVHQDIELDLNIAIPLIDKDRVKQACETIKKALAGATGQAVTLSQEQAIESSLTDYYDDIEKIVAKVEENCRMIELPFSDSSDTLEAESTPGELGKHPEWTEEATDVLNSENKIDSHPIVPILQQSDVSPELVDTNEYSGLDILSAGDRAFVEARQHEDNTPASRLDSRFRGALRDLSQGLGGDLPLGKCIGVYALANDEEKKALYISLLSIAGTLSNSEISASQAVRLVDDALRAPIAFNDNYLTRIVDEIIIFDEATREYNWLDKLTFHHAQTTPGKIGKFISYFDMDDLSRREFELREEVALSRLSESETELTKYFWGLYHLANELPLFSALGHANNPLVFGAHSCLISTLDYWNNYYAMTPSDERNVKDFFSQYGTSILDATGKGLALDMIMAPFRYGRMLPIKFGSETLNMLQRSAIEVPVLIGASSIIHEGKWPSLSEFTNSAAILATMNIAFHGINYGYMRHIARNQMLRQQRIVRQCLGEPQESTGASLAKRDIKPIQSYSGQPEAVNEAVPSRTKPASIQLKKIPMLNNTGNEVLLRYESNDFHCYSNASPELLEEIAFHIKNSTGAELKPLEDRPLYGHKYGLSDNTDVVILVRPKGSFPETYADGMVYRAADGKQYIIHQFCSDVPIEQQMKANSEKPTISKHENFHRFSKLGNIEKFNEAYLAKLEGNPEAFQPFQEFIDACDEMRLNNRNYPHMYSDSQRSIIEYVIQGYCRSGEAILELKGIGQSEVLSLYDRAMIKCVEGSAYTISAIQKYGVEAVADAIPEMTRLVLDDVAQIGVSNSAAKVDSIRSHAQSRRFFSHFSAPALEAATSISDINPSLNRQRVLSALTVDPTKSDLDNMSISHGTKQKYVSSVLEGPENIGSGGGGKGLYVAPKGYEQVAEEYAGPRTNSAVPASERGVVMKGVISSPDDKPLRHARIRIASRVRTSEVNYEKGIFPFDWAKDKALQRFMHENFDVIEIIGAESAGYAISDRFFVIHESAGPNAINWTSHSASQLANTPGKPSSILSQPKTQARPGKYTVSEHGKQTLQNPTLTRTFQAATKPNAQQQAETITPLHSRTVHAFPDIVNVEQLTAKYGLQDAPPLYMNRITYDIVDLSKSPPIEQLTSEEVMARSYNGKTEKEKFIYVIRADGKLVISSRYSKPIKIENGGIFRDYSRNGMTRAEPITHDGVVYSCFVDTNTGTKYLFNRLTHRAEWRFEQIKHPDLAISSSTHETDATRPIFFGGEVYVHNGVISHVRGGINNKTGHYRNATRLKHVREAQRSFIENIFREAGFDVDIDTVQFPERVPTSGHPYAPRSINMNVRPESSQPTTELPKTNGTKQKPPTMGSSLAISGIAAIGLQAVKSTTLSSAESDSKVAEPQTSLPAPASSGPLPETTQRHQLPKREIPGLNVLSMAQSPPLKPIDMTPEALHECFIQAKPPQAPDVTLDLIRYAEGYNAIFANKKYHTPHPKIFEMVYGYANEPFNQQQRREPLVNDVSYLTPQQFRNVARGQQRYGGVLTADWQLTLFEARSSEGIRVNHGAAANGKPVIMAFEITVLCRSLPSAQPKIDTIYMVSPDSGHYRPVIDDSMYNILLDVFTHNGFSGDNINIVTDSHVGSSYSNAAKSPARAFQGFAARKAAGQDPSVTHYSSLKSHPPRQVISQAADELISSTSRDRQSAQSSASIVSPASSDMSVPKRQRPHATATRPAQGFFKAPVPADRSLSSDNKGPAQPTTRDTSSAPLDKPVSKRKMPSTANVASVSGTSKTKKSDPRFKELKRLFSYDIVKPDPVSQPSSTSSSQDAAPPPFFADPQPFQRVVAVEPHPGLIRADFTQKLGNCLFDALEPHLEFNFRERDLRNRVVDYIEAHPELYENQAVGGEPVRFGNGQYGVEVQSFEHFVDLLRQPEAWAGEIVLSALSEMTGRQIAIHHKGRIGIGRTIEDVITPYNHNPLTSPIFVTYNRRHYQSLIQNAEIDGNLLLAQLQDLHDRVHSPDRQQSPGASGR